MFSDLAMCVLGSGLDLSGLHLFISFNWALLRSPACYWAPLKTRVMRGEIGISIKRMVFNSSIRLFYCACCCSNP